MVEPRDKLHLLFSFGIALYRIHVKDEETPDPIKWSGLVEPESTNQGPPNG